MLTHLETRVLAPDETINLPQPLIDAECFVGTESWTEFIRRTYGYQSFRIVAEGEGQALGLLVLTHVQHRLFGKYLVTAPFGSYGGFAFETNEARDVILARAAQLGSELQVDYVNVRFDGDERMPPVGWVQYPAYATYRVQLLSDPEKLLGSYHPDHRNHIRKSLRKGFQIRFGRLDLLDDVYKAMTRSMHELGSPYHSQDYLRSMADTLGETLEFAVLDGPNGELAGAGVFISHGDVVTNLHANILRKFRSDYVGEFLYWSAIMRYNQKGYRIFDLGRSLIGSGNEAFKSKWKPAKKLLAYWYALREGRSLPEINQKNPAFKAAVWAWKRLPTFAVELLGPGLIRGVA